MTISIVSLKKSGMSALRGPALAKSLQNQLRLPVIGAPLFIVSNPALVIAQCKAGIVGSFPALNARPKEMLVSADRSIAHGS